MPCSSSHCKSANCEEQVSWDKFIAALKQGIGPGVQHGKELMGPLASFHHVEKLIPQLVNSFLELNAVFTYGPIAEGLLDALNADEASEDTAKEASGTQRPCQTHINAFHAILQLDPDIEKVLKRLSEMMEEDGYHDSLL
ncbi:hypothetical protein C0989_001576 [Termitomyces sp. Mn162]|nr:hypothetical protein C0989_001576 [Termitomyces sp. Mn162]